MRPEIRSSRALLGLERTSPTSKCLTALYAPFLRGFFDFLAYLSFHNHSEPPFSVVVLNSGALKARAVAHILERKYDEVRLFLDNDQTGDAGTTYFQELLGTISVDDCRDQYHGFKDFNEMTMSDSSGFSFSS